MSISASLVKELRERTGAGMMECKKALEEVNGNLEDAITAMRKSGQAKAAKRAGRIAAEGLISMALTSDQKVGFLVEVNCETDFVARGEDFKTFVSELTARGLQMQTDDVATLLAVQLHKDHEQTIEQARQALVAKLGENINIRRVKLIKADGVVGGYLHGERIGVLVALDRAQPQLGRDLAMHIAATHPLAISPEDLSPDIISKERDIFIAQAKESGKPDNIIEKMVGGRIEKFLQEVCLINQAFVKDPDQIISKLLQSQQTKVTAFVRFEVGEGIEKQEKDFADEVKAYTGK